MSNVLSVNEVIDRADELDRKPVEIVGLLTFEFENHSLGHSPKAERRQIMESVDPPYCQSSVWITFGAGSIQPNQEVLTRWTGKRVRISEGCSQAKKGSLVAVISAAGDAKLRLIRLNVSELR